MKIKKVLFISIIMTSSYTYAQTDIIAQKSHSGLVKEIKGTSKDNFGGPQFSRGYLIDTIRRLNDSIVLQIGENGIDSVCHHPYLNDTNVSIETLQNLYDPRIKFVGFDKNIKIIKEPKKYKNGFTWGIGLILTFSFVSTILFTKKKHLTNE